MRSLGPATRLIPLLLATLVGLSSTALAQSAGGAATTPQPAAEPRVPDRVTVAIVDNLAPLSWVTEDGRSTGLVVDLWKAWADKVGVEIRFRPRDWDGARDLLGRGRADFHGSVPWAEVPPQDYLLGSPIYRYDVTLFQTLRRGRQGSLPGLGGHSVGVVAGSLEQQHLQKNFGTIVAEPFATVDEALFALLQGRVSAVLAPTLVGQDRIEELGLAGDISSEQTIVVSAPLRAMVPADQPQLLDLIEQGLEQLTQGERAAIERRWVSTPSLRQIEDLEPAMELVGVEKAWLQENPKLRVAIDRNWPPYEFQNEDGGFEGLVVDHLEHVATELGVQLEYVGYDQWIEAADKAQRGDIDILPSTSNTLERQQFLAFTRPYTTSHTAIFAQENDGSVATLDELVGKTVVVVRGQAIDQKISAGFPRIELLRVATTREALNAVSRDQADAYVGNLRVATFIIRQENIDNVVIAGPSPFGDIGLAMAVPREREILAGILDKVLAAMPTAQKEAIGARWFGLRGDGGMDLKEILVWVVPAIAGLLVIVGFVTVSNQRLRREIAQRHEAESALRQSETVLAAKSALMTTMLDSIDQGFVLWDSEYRLAAWNEKILDFWMRPIGVAREGMHVTKLLTHLAKVRGEADPGAWAVQEFKRLSTDRPEGMDRFTMPDGRIIDVCRYTMPDGGHVATYTDVTERERATEERARQNEMFERILESSPIGVSILRKDGTRLFVNRRQVQNFGASSKEELLSLNASASYLYEGERDETVAGIERQEGQRVVDREVKRMRLDGSAWWGLLNVMPFEYEGEQVWLTWMEDITERKAQEQALADASAELQLSLNNMTDGLLLLDEDLRVRNFNQQYQGYFGGDRQVIQRGIRFRDVIQRLAESGAYGDGDWRQIANRREREFLSGLRHTREVRLEDGRIIEVRSAPISDGGVVAVATDITRRKRMEDSMQRRLKIEEIVSAISADLTTASAEDLEDRFASALSVLGDFTGSELCYLWEWDEEKKAATQRISRYGTGKVERAFSEPTIDYADMPWVFDRLEQCQILQFNKLSEIPDSAPKFKDRLRRNNVGATLLVPIPLGDGLGGILGFDAVNRENAWREDDTRLLIVVAEIIGTAMLRFRTETALRSAKDEAEQAARAKSAFLAAMSHEIRTPMNGVVGMLDVLAQTKVDTDQRQMLLTMRESAFSLLTIIDDILDFSKIEAGKLVLESIPISVRDTVEGVAETLVSYAAKRDVSLSCFIDPALPAKVLGDQVRLRQILFNLGGNAIKFTGEDSWKLAQVTMRADLVPADHPDSFGDDPKMVTVRYQVSDTGIGMSEEVLCDLFQPFTQAESSTTRRFGGTGLGLSICKRLTEMMAGEIRVRSVQGEGSTFEVLLPYRIDPETAAEDQARPPTDLADLRVLSVFYRDINREVVTRYLEAAGVETAEAVELEEALPRSRAAHEAGRPFDVVVIGTYWSDNARAAVVAAAEDDPRLERTRFVLMTNTRAGAVCVSAPNAVSVPHDPLRWSALMNAIAVATGRESPEVDTEVAEEAVNVRTVPTVAEAEADGRLILVAEDNTTNQIVINRQLGMLGYAAEIMDDGKQALEAWRSKRYGILLTDCHMPEMDGFELAQAIRAEEAGTGRRIPIVAITANALEGESDRCIAIGMDGYLTKPLELSKLRSVLDDWIPLPELAAADTETETAKPANGRGNGAEEASDDEPQSAIDKFESGVDPAALVELFDDDEEGIRDLLHQFGDQGRAIIAEIVEAGRNSQQEPLYMAAHKLKSSARTVGAFRLGELCQSVEFAGKDADWGTIETLLPELQSEMVVVDAYIDAY